MKRFLVLMLSALIAANLVACGCGTTNNGNDVTNEGTVENAPAAAPEDTPAEMPIPEENEEITNEVTGETVGTVLANEFHSIKVETPDITAQEMADAILANPMIQFGGAAMEVEEGILSGFGNTEIKGFKEGVMFAPMISSIPFVGYVFTLEDGADVDAFMQTLEENADPRWNICTEAEETVVEKADSMVFFVMCPSQFE